MSMKDIGEKYYFVSLWEEPLYGIKGALVNKETGKLLVVGKGNKRRTHFFADSEKLKKEGITILRGKKRNKFLQKFNWVNDKNGKFLRKSKR